MSPGIGRLQICGSSRLADYPPLVSALRNSGFLVEPVECLDQCFRCRSSYFALAFGRMVFAAGPDALWLNLGLTGAPPLSGSPPPQSRLRIARENCGCSYCRSSKA